MLIVDAAGAAALPEALGSLPRGAALVQVRDKALPVRALLSLVKQVQALGARVLVNDRADVALATGAAGVHLPEDGMPVAAARTALGAGRLISAAAHGVAGAQAKAADGADLVLLAPIWEGHGDAIGLAALSEAAAKAAAPIYALGGVVDAARARAAREAGAHGVAVVRGLASARAIWEAISA